MNDKMQNDVRAHDRLDYLSPFFPLSPLLFFGFPSGGYCVLIMSLTERAEWAVVSVVCIHVPWLERSGWMDGRVVFA